jgi:hypothetical protein
MKNLADWARLANAASDARDDLRNLIPILDQIIASKAPSVALLVRIRELATRHAEALRLALKHPAQPAAGSPARKIESW